jgi:hypothetical protein
MFDIGVYTLINLSDSDQVFLYRRPVPAECEQLLVPLKGVEGVEARIARDTTSNAALLSRWWP